jgi:hypothetical protein
VVHDSLNHEMMMMSGQTLHEQSWESLPRGTRLPVTFKKNINTRPDYRNPLSWNIDPLLAAVETKTVCIKAGDREDRVYRRDRMTSLQDKRTFLYLIILLFVSPICSRQFGVLNNNNEQVGDIPHSDDIAAVSKEDMKQYMIRAAILQAASPNIPSQDAVDLAVLLDAVIQDPETKTMVENLLSADGRKATLEAFSDSLTQQQVVDALKQTMDD